MMILNSNGLAVAIHVFMFNILRVIEVCLFPEEKLQLYELF